MTKTEPCIYCDTPVSHLPVGLPSSKVECTNCWEVRHRVEDMPIQVLCSILDKTELKAYFNFNYDYDKQK